MPEKKTLLEVNRLSVRYGSAEIVKNVSFCVREGEWLVIAGPNGAGKSTLLSAIAQSAPYTGLVRLDGADARKMKSRERARKMGVLMQSHFVGYGFSVEEVVRMGRYAYSGGLLNAADEDGESAFREAVRLTGLDRYLSQSILTVSGGESQRAFLAQLLCQNPALMLLDEPTNHLDLKYQKEIFSLVSEWLKTPGRAVVSVVHDLSVARAFGERALLMNRGEAVAEGPVEQVLTDSRLNEVYEMDVRGWMKTLLNPWI